MGNFIKTTYDISLDSHILFLPLRFSRPTQGKGPLGLARRELKERKNSRESWFISLLVKYFTNKWSNQRCPLRKEWFILATWPWAKIEPLFFRNSFQWSTLFLLYLAPFQMGQILEENGDGSRKNCMKNAFNQRNISLNWSCFSYLQLYVPGTGWNQHLPRPWTFNW